MINYMNFDFIEENYGENSGVFTIVICDYIDNCDFFCRVGIVQNGLNTEFVLL